MGDHEPRDRNKQRTRATAGPSADDRFGRGPIGTNVESRILAVTVEGERTRVTRARGKNNGVHVGMEGYIAAAGGMLSELQIDSADDYRCHGFAHDMAIAVLAHAGHRLDRLGLPIEIEIDPPNSGRDAMAFLVVDERGQLRASRNWGELQGAGPRARNAEFYATPENMWKALQRAPLPSNIVEKG